MLPRLWTSSVILSSISLLATVISSASAPTKCYVLDGTHKIDAGYRCNNETTGHSSCCAIGGLCYSNGVCQQSNGNIQDYLRVGCTDPTWKDPACLDQCTTFAKSSTAGIRFCNGAITNTNKYCCDDGSFGAGSFACCQSPSDIFAINPVATVMAQIPLTYSSTSTSSSSTSTSVPASSTTPAAVSSTSSPPTNTPTASPSKKSSNSVAIGVGVAVPVVVILAAIFGFCFWRKRKNARKHQAVEMDNNGVGPGVYSDQQPPPMETEGDTPGVVGGQKYYFGGRQYNSPPQEMMQPHAVHELGTDSRR